jgi:hypothetical protein
MKSLPLIVLLLSALACTLPEPKKPVASKPTPTQTPVPTVKPTATIEQALSTTVETFTAEFSANEVAATERYKDRLVEMDGVVADIKSSYIKFEGTGHIAVICNYTDSRGVTSLVKGQRATVVGRSNGLTLSIYAYLFDCRVK